MIHEVISYKDAILVSHSSGVDIIDPITNKWRVAQSIQAAKWNLSVWRRLCAEFSPAKENYIAAV